MTAEAHTDIIDLIPAYALGILDAEEAGKVARHLAVCAACREELAAYQIVVDELSYAAPMVPPPPEIKRRLMAQVNASAARKTAVSATPSWWQRMTAVLESMFARPRWQLAIPLLLLLVLIGSVVLWQGENDVPNGQEIILTATDVAPDARGTITISSNAEEGTLTVAGLPPLPPEQQYQLWLIEDGRRVSGGVFSVDAEGKASLPLDAPQPLNEYNAFGITIEPAGGSPGPTGERVLGHNL